MKHIKTFEGLNTGRSPREILDIFSDVFIGLEDMGGWLGYDNGKGFSNIDHHGPICVDDPGRNEFGQIRIYYKGDNLDNPKEFYLYLKDNLYRLIERFEKLSNHKVIGLKGYVSFQSKGIR
jgi:hypothetical protein